MQPQDLVQYIQKLQEQKNLLTEKLLVAQRTRYFSAGDTFIDLQKRRNSEHNHLHLNNVGILQVPINATRGKEEENLVRIQSADKSQIQKLSITKQQNNILLQKINLMKEKFQEFEKQRLEVLKVLEKAEIKLKKKKNRNLSLKQMVREKNIENSKLRQIIMLYHNQNTNGLRKLSVSTLDKVERDLLRFLDSLKSQKALRVFNKKFSLLHKNMDSSLISSFIETARNLSEVELNNPFISRKEEVFDDIKFEEDFFTFNESNDLDGSETRSKKNKKLLNTTLKSQVNAFDNFKAGRSEEIGSAQMEIENDSPSEIKISVGKLTMWTPKRCFYKFFGLQMKEGSGVKLEVMPESMAGACDLVNGKTSCLKNICENAPNLDGGNNFNQPLSLIEPIQTVVAEVDEINHAARNLAEEMKLVSTTHGNWKDTNDENTDAAEYCLKGFKEQGLRSLLSETGLKFSALNDLQIRSETNEIFGPKHACLNL